MDAILGKSEVDTSKQDALLAKQEKQIAEQEQMETLEQEKKRKAAISSAKGRRTSANIFERVADVAPVGIRTTLG